MKKVIGMDLGDKKNVVVVFDAEGKESSPESIVNTEKQVRKYFEKHPGAVVVMEAGTHSPWISRLLESMGHEVLVGNPRKMRAIWDSTDKSDERDARVLGLMYRLEPRLLYRIRHRSEKSQTDLAMIKSRQVLVESRTKLINHVRSIVKSMGLRISSCSSASFHKRAQEDIPVSLWDALGSVVEQIEHLTITIGGLDKQIKWKVEGEYSEAKHLMQINGVGELTALAYVLTLEESSRFKKSRTVGAFLGLVPRRDQSGDSDKQLPITRAGNTYMRQLLVSCAHHIMGPFGKDSDLRRHGEKIARRGGKNAKKRAVVAVARKLATLMHKLWKTREEYIPLYKNSLKAA